MADGSSSSHISENVTSTEMTEPPSSELLPSVANV
jgi:hypothetical protein